MYQVISFKEICEESVAQQMKRLRNAQWPDGVEAAVRRVSITQAEEERQQLIEEWKTDMGYMLQEIQQRKYSFAVHIVVSTHETSIGPVFLNCY